MSAIPPLEIQIQIRELRAKCESYFDLVSLHYPPKEIETLEFYTSAETTWNALPESIRESATGLLKDLLVVSATIAKEIQGSSLGDAEDLADLRRATKTARAAIRLRKYQFHQADVIHDEGTVLGFRPASQTEIWPLDPSAARTEFQQQLLKLIDIYRLAEFDLVRSDSKTNIGEVQSTQKYRAGSCFIMMWMDPLQKDLLDVVDAVKTVFRSFDVSAVRADEIEHEGLISERVLNEIRTAEFLFADLTGARPNVYYEVGYAHALGKRVILYRKSGTGLHFDLANYNCPEYENLRDLRFKLTRRLIDITNRNPKADTEV